MGEFSEPDTVVWNHRKPVGQDMARIYPGAAAALLLTLSSTGFAQSIQSLVPQVTVPTTTRMTTGGISDVTDSKLRAFVAALSKVDPLMNNWQARIKSAGSEQQKTMLQTRANTEIAAAIEGTEGISVAEYQSIGQVAQNDQALLARIQQMFKAQ